LNSREDFKENKCSSDAKRGGQGEGKEGFSAPADLEGEVSMVEKVGELGLREGEGLAIQRNKESGGGETV